MDFSVKQGVLAGVITVVLFLIVYFIDKEMMIHPMLWWGSLGIYIWFIAQAVKEPAMSGVQLGIKEGFKAFVFANAIFYLFYYVMLVHIDPTLQDLQWEQLVNHPNYDGKVTREQMAVDAGKLFFSYIYSLIGGFVIAAALAFLQNKTGTKKIA